MKMESLVLHYSRGENYEEEIDKYSFSGWEVKAATWNSYFGEITFVLQRKL